MRLPQHLTHLERDRVGRPVPYINMWGDERDLSRWLRRYDRVLGRDGSFYRDDKDAGPNFFKQSPQRQRECMALGKCEVCGREVPWPDRLLPISSVSVESVTVEGRQAVVVYEPWLCPDCADFAARICPALIRRRHAEDLTMVPVPHPHYVQAIAAVGTIDGPYEASTQADPVVLMVKLRLLHVDLVTR